MSEYIEVGQPLQFTDPNTPTRVGEIVENVSDIYNIPSPRLGMQVFVKNEKKSFVITSLKSKTIGGVDVPEAAVEAFEPVGAKSFTWNNDTDPSNMNDFVVAGVYDIKGEHTREDDNLPILNTGGGHTFNARLTVLDSSITGSGNSDDKCITQVLSFCNRLGQGEVYIRTGKGSSLDSLTWEKWSTLQRNANVGQVDNLDNLKDNGIYSGVWTKGSYNAYPLTFVCIVINDYFVGAAPRRISQFVYGLSKFDGSTVYQSRVWDDSKNAWSDWEILNQKKISSMISAEIKKVTDGIDPNKIDSLKDIITWIEEHGGDVTAIYNAIQQNTVKINAEVNRAINKEQEIGNKLNEETQRAHDAEWALHEGLNQEATARGNLAKEIKSNAMQYDTLGVYVRADKAEIYGRSINTTTRVVEFPAATTEKAGVMSAEDKNALESVNSVINIGEYPNMQAVWNACRQIALNNPEISIIKYSVKAGVTYNSGVVFQSHHYNDAVVTQYYLYGGGQKHECNVRHIVSDGTTDDWQPIQMFTSYKFENGTLYGYKYGESESEQNKVAIVSIPIGSAVAELIQEVTYSELVALRDKARLVPGMKYRITDYVTTTVQNNTKSANHPFDVIVEAVSENELSELAQAIQHEGDTYFEGNDLDAWQLWYDLDNNTDKYEWADAENGKGVIYRMIDEKRNDCPYDFKNILFIRCKLNAPVVGGYTYEWLNKMSENINKMFEKNHLSYIWHGNNNEEDYYWEDEMGEVISSPTGETKAFFTFSNVVNDIVTDKSITSVCHNNIIKESVGAQLRLNNIVFFSTGITSSCNYNSFGNSCYYNSFGNSCNYNSFGSSCNYNSFGNSCYSNSFGNDCYYNSFGSSCNYNSFGNDFYSNSFGNSCNYNSFGNSCYSNSFGNSCYYNSFGNSCNYNSFGSSCNYNSFGNSCYSNSFGNDCYSNSFGSSCNYNSFGNSCYSNSFGNDCYSNSFRDGPAYAFNEDYWEYSYDDELIDGVRGNKFGDRCQNLLIHTYATTGEENSIQNLNIAQGLCSIELDDNDIFIPLPIEIDIVGQNYELKIGRDSNDEIKVYCEADLV